MTVFRRRNRKQEDVTADAAAQAAVESGETPEAPARAGGPWDADAAPDDGVDRLDLGALRVPTLEGTEIRLEADEDGQITSVLLVSEGSALQIGAFAAPRTEGIWSEVRGEILAGIAAESGAPREVDGPYGDELQAELDTPDGRQLVRFVGFDGPRWFLRGVFSGAAGTDAGAAPALDRALLGTVVVRGGDPLPVRDPLPLHLPREVLDAQRAAAEEDERRLTLPERGPEITETR
ncbi:MAG TPA: DUF3710 domain-containing protein [Mycobacteriales bacterium]|nr:DUF3710 domain-containing protein [Mycobacteriales bacterium]